MSTAALPLLLALALPPAQASPPPPPPTETVRLGDVYGYLPYWESMDDVMWEHLTHLAIFSVGANSDGTLNNTSRWTGRAEEAVTLGATYGVKVHLCVTNFDASSLHSLLSSSSRRATLVEALGDQVDAYGADGVNVDFEGMDGADSASLVAFITELKARVPEVWVATPMIDWDGAYDYSELTRISDGVFIMGYALHGSWGDAGPNIPLYGSDRWGRYGEEWSIDDYEAYAADLSKVIFGLPSYGQSWYVNNANDIDTSTIDFIGSISYINAEAEAAAYGKQWDEASDTAWYAASSTEQVWYDDAQSIEVKGEYAMSRGLAGIGFWALGYDGRDPTFWAAVDRVTTTTAASYAAEWVDQSFPTPSEGVLELTLDESASGWVDLLNTGAATWEPGSTYLAPTPREVASDWAAADWPSPTRAATVAASTPPGAVGRFTFSLRGNELGSGEQGFGLVEEGVVWFADEGGPADGAIAVSIEVQDSRGGGDDGETDEADEPVGSVEPGGKGSSCATLPAPQAFGWALGALALLGRRRRA
jgi:spore germination protein YaaH